jgi:hypothetical protein
VLTEAQFAAAAAVAAASASQVEDPIQICHEAVR